MKTKLLMYQLLILAVVLFYLAVIRITEFFKLFNKCVRFLVSNLFYEPCLEKMPKIAMLFLAFFSANFFPFAG